MTSACATHRRPNILFVMTDDHSVTEASCYGNRILKTPNLDRLAAEGVRFTNAFVTNSLCAPSRASVLTGCYSHIHGIRGNSEMADSIEHIDPNLPTFPQLLQKAGYRTGIVGKWHLSHNPAGFDYWCVLPGQGVYFNPDFIDNGTRKKYQGYATDITTDLALEFLRKNDRRPFCLLYQHKAPHRPFQPAPRHAKLFDDIELPYPATYNDDYATRRIAKEAEDMRFDVSLAPDYKDLPTGLSAEERKKWTYQRFVKDHYRALYGVDENLGRVFDYLDRAKLTQDTLVIYTTDNGFFLGEHGWYDKRFMYEPSLRLPLLARYPRMVPAGKVEDHMVLNIDYAPTILDFAGVEIPVTMQGRSLRPILEGKPPADWRRSIYYTYYENSWAMRQKGGAVSDPSFQYATPHRVVPHRGVRTDRYKLIQYYGEGDYWELFDLQADPNELKNVYDDAANAQVANDLKRELARLKAQYKDNG
ncbi:MAG: sulfatase [Acidobacteria bacterium]|nr:sulfatase [Acidobacteriota bacterium]